MMQQALASQNNYIPREQAQTFTGSAAVGRTNPHKNIQGWMPASASLQGVLVGALLLTSLPVARLFSSLSQAGMSEDMRMNNDGFNSWNTLDVKHSGLNSAASSIDSSGFKFDANKAETPNLTRRADECGFEKMSTEALLTYVFGENSSVTLNDIQQDTVYSRYTEMPIPVSVETRRGLYNRHGYGDYAPGFPLPLQSNEVEILQDAIKYWNTALNTEALRFVDGPLNNDYGLVVQHCGTRETLYSNGAEAFASFPSSDLVRSGFICLNPLTDTNPDPLRTYAHEVGHAAFGLIHPIQTADEAGRTIISKNWLFPTSPRFAEFKGMSSVMAYETNESLRDGAFNVDCPAPVDILQVRAQETITDPFCRKNGFPLFKGFCRVGPHDTFTMRNDKSFYPLDRLYAALADGVTLGVINAFVGRIVAQLKDHEYIHQKVPVDLLRDLAFAVSVMAAYGLKAGGLAVGVAAVRSLIKTPIKMSINSADKNVDTNNNMLEERVQQNKLKLKPMFKPDDTHFIDFIVPQYLGTYFLKDIVRYGVINPQMLTQSTSSFMSYLLTDISIALASRAIESRQTRSPPDRDPRYNNRESQIELIDITTQDTQETS